MPTVNDENQSGAVEDDGPCTLSEGVCKEAKSSIVGNCKEMVRPRQGSPTKKTFSVVSVSVDKEKFQGRTN